MSTAFDSVRQGST